MKFWMLGCVIFMASNNDALARTNPDGWTLGFGGISVEGSTSAPFPILESMGQSTMVLPNISYKKEQWQFGTNGIQWNDSTDNGLELEISAGYPGASIQLNKNDQWRSYSVEGGINYWNGLMSEIKLGAFGVAYQYSQGFETREGQKQHEWSIKFPILIAKDDQSILFVTSSYDQSNESFIQNEITTASNDEFYATKSLGVFFVRQLTQKSNLVGSFSVNNPEIKLQNLLPEVPRYPIKAFFMYSYYLGK